MTAKEYHDYHGEWPDDGIDDDDREPEEACT
jgi:hypothetical protein